MSNITYSSLRSAIISLAAAALLSACSQAPTNASMINYSYIPASTSGATLGLPLDD